MTTHEVQALPFNEEIVAKTIQNTVKKYKYTKKELMYRRTPVELLDNIFMGDLAKNALLYYLKTKTNTPIFDYDDLRTDAFKKPDPNWDFYFLLNEKQIKAEVKSSIPTRNESPENVIKNRDIKITASHDNGKNWLQPTDLEAILHFQIYFYGVKTYRNGFDDFDKLYAEIAEKPNRIRQILKIEKYKKPLFFGWCSKKEIQHFKNTLSPNTWTFPSTKRIYWRAPIAAAHDLPYLFELLEK